MKYNPKDLITLDFESFYSVEYSLSKKIYNTSAYIRDPQFKAECCSIKEGTKPAKCYTGAAMVKKLKSIDWSTKDLLCHHAHFDGLILAHHYGIVPRKYFCTLSMSRALHSEYASKKLGEIGKLYGLGGKLDEGAALVNAKGKHIEDMTPEERQKYMDYCDQDVELTFGIFMKQIEVFPEDETELIDLTVRMFTQPTLILNRPRCERSLNEEIQKRQVGIAVGCHAAGLTSEKDLTSNTKFVAALKKLGVDAPMKISKYNGERTYALSENDEDFVALLEHEDSRVVRLVEGRLAAKSTIGETRANRLLQAGENGQAIPVYLNYYGAKTGRWSGGNKLNFQNFPRGSELRKSLLAPPGHVIVVADSAQIEARMLAWVAENELLLSLFRNKQDVYKFMANQIYGVPVEKVSPEQRFIGKIATLGLGYGMGATKFQTTLALGTMGPAVEMPLNECDKIVKKYRKINVAATMYWRAMDGVLDRIVRGEEGELGCLSYDEEGIWLPNGLGILYPGIKKQVDLETNRANFSYFSKNKWSKLYGGLVTENVVQALSRVAVAEQMLDYRDWLAKQTLRKTEVARIVTMTHDEIVSVVPERLAEKATKAKVKFMQTARPWCPDLPFDAEGGFAREYSK